MSTHYTLAFNCMLDPAVGAEQLNALDYLFGLAPDSPSKFPDHWFFECASAEQIAQTRVLSRDPADRFLKRLWRETKADGRVVALGVNLVVPGYKLEGIYDHEGLLGFMGWLASFSLDYGLVGTISPCDGTGPLEEQLHALLYIQRRELYLSSGVGADLSVVSP